MSVHVLPFLVKTDASFFKRFYRTGCQQAKPSHLLQQVEDSAQSLASFKDIIEEFRGRIQEVENNNFVLIHAVDDVEKATKSIQQKIEVNSANQLMSLVCNYCDKEFENEVLLQNHTRIDHRSGRVRIKRQN